MSKKYMVDVNTAALQEFIDSYTDESGKHITGEQFGIMLGHSDSWFAHVMCGKMALNDAYHIKAYFGFDVTAKDEPEPEINDISLSAETAETNQWLCEISEKLDKLDNSDKIINKLDELIKAVNHLAAVTDNYPKSVIITKKPQAYIR